MLLYFAQVLPNKLKHLSQISMKSADDKNETHEVNVNNDESKVNQQTISDIETLFK